MLFKGSNNLVQIYRSFAITGNYGRQSFSKYGISYYMFTMADVNIHASNRQIWYRHPNKENTGNDEFQNVQRESKHGFFILWELHSKILVGDKNLLVYIVIIVDKRKGYVLLLINAGVRNSVSQRKKSWRLLHDV
jgi:hypothetical protein